MTYAFSTDVTPPALFCPGNMTVESEPELHYAIVNLTDPSPLGTD